MPSQLATTAADQNTFGSFLDILVHDFFPVLALAAGLMTVIWVVCAAIMISGYLLGTAVVFGVRALVDACLRDLRRRKGVEDTQLGAVDAYTKIVSLDRYRRRRQHRRQDNVQADDPFQPHSDDDPA